MNKTINPKKWGITVLALILIFVIAVGAAVYYVDPFLHFHCPTAGLSYPYVDERYMNDGIARHFDYEAIIAGTSIAENFKVSEVEELWGFTTIKQTAASATFYEQDGYVRRALSHNPRVKLVIRSLDATRLVTGPADESYDDIPKYLYDENVFNDVRYLYNKDVIQRVTEVINYTRAGNATKNMDEYGVWYPYATYGRDEVLAGLIDYSDFTEEVMFDELSAKTLWINVEENVLKTAREHPDTEFVFFIPPYSAAYWYGMVKTKQLSYTIEAYKLAVSRLLTEGNIKVYDFSDKVDITTNLDNYMDTLHYGEWINDEMLRWMHKGEGLLTLENYETHLDNVKEIYENYNYDYE
jgi:hypothetical protein